MARGRHRRRSGLLSRLLPRRRRAVAVPPSRVPSVRAELARLETEVARSRSLSAAMAETAAAALVRAVRAEDLAAAAAARAGAAEQQLAAAHGELAGLRGDLAALREELVWAFADGRLPVDAPAEAPVVVDLRDGAARTA